LLIKKLCLLSHQLSIVDVTHRQTASGGVMLVPPQYREQKLLGRYVSLNEYESTEVYFLEVPFPWILHCNGKINDDL